MWRKTMRNMKGNSDELQSMDKQDPEGKQFGGGDFTIRALA